MGSEHSGLDLTVTEPDPAGMPEALRARQLDVALVHDYDILPGAKDSTLDSARLLDETILLATTGDEPSLKAYRDAA